MVNHLQPFQVLFINKQRGVVATIKIPIDDNSAPIFTGAFRLIRLRSPPPWRQAVRESERGERDFLSIFFGNKELPVLIGSEYFN